VQERIAGDVLSLARIQLDMLSLHFVEMDLRKEAKKVLSVFASEAKMKKIEIVLELGGSLEALQIRGIKTDPVRLGQVLTNLTANAIRFTAAAETRRITVHYEVGLEPPLPGTLVPPPNMPFPIVTPLSEDTPLYLYVSVTDTGPGMTPDEQKMLFKRFQQSNKMIHTRYGGSGLGLFICKKIVELLGGAIAVESEIDVGSVFRFWIKTHTVAPADLTSPSVSPSPLPIPAPQTLRVGSMESTAAEPPSPQPVQQAIPAEPPEALRLLIVEDNIINQTVLKRQLVKAGFVCDTANDGQEALVRIHEANRECRHDTPGQLGGYDIVLMDLEMPVMDGLTAIRHIRDAERRGILRPQLVIALTGNARQGQIDQARAAGMDDGESPYLGLARTEFVLMPSHHQAVPPSGAHRHNPRRVPEPPRTLGPGQRVARRARARQRADVGTVAAPRLTELRHQRPGSRRAFRGQRRAPWQQEEAQGALAAPRHQRRAPPARACPGLGRRHGARAHRQLKLDSLTL
jgi:CheY-like chemotaxis protein